MPAFFATATFFLIHRSSFVSRAVTFGGRSLLSSCQIMWQNPSLMNCMLIRFLRLFLFAAGALALPALPAEVRDLDVRVTLAGFEPSSFQLKPGTSAHLESFGRPT